MNEGDVPALDAAHYKCLYSSFTYAGAATQRHLVNCGSFGLLPARTHVRVLVATTRCASDNNGE
jgi:hypothetical protein